MKIAFCIHGLVGSKKVKYGSVDKNQNIESKIPYKHFKKNIHRLKNVIGNVGLYKIGLVEKFFVITSI